MNIIYAAIFIFAVGSASCAQTNLLDCLSKKESNYRIVCFVVMG